MSQPRNWSFLAGGMFALSAWIVVIETDDRLSWRAENRLRSESAECRWEARDLRRELDALRQALRTQDEAAAAEPGTDSPP